ncbi:hypothetical protein BGZ57DRAFT_829634, partial [Hyaloscypha finlandica]
MAYLESLCRRRGWRDPIYETYRSSSGFTALALVNGREYQTDLAYESENIARGNVAMRAFMVCRNFSVNGGMLARNGVVQGLPPSISESTVEFAKRVCNNITLRREELQDLEENSIGVSNQLRDLLSLKQQQASTIEAKLALKRADESLIQGRSIMLFTIVTIIFLPLLFMTSVLAMHASVFAMHASVFAMNASEFETPTGGNS